MNIEMMQRRTFLLASATTVSAAAIAGCTGSDDTDYQEGGGPGEDDDQDSDEDESDGGEDTPDEEDVKSREQGEDFLEFGDLVITDHELVVEGEDGLEDVLITGVVANEGDERYDYVEVGARMYNSDGQQLDRYMTNTEDLDAGAEWAFEIGVYEDEADIDDYDIGVQGSQY